MRRALTGNAFASMKTKVNHGRISSVAARGRHNGDNVAQ
jgi:hypothetical protein